MKKVLLGFVILILVLIIGTWIFLSVRENQSKKQLIHPQSTFLIDIAFDDIIKDVTFNAFANPAYYLTDTIDANKKKSNISLFNIGWKIPAHLYFFNIPSDTNTIYSIQKITNLTDFQFLIENKLKMEIDPDFKQDGFQYAHSENSHLSILFNKNELAIAISTDKKVQSNQLLTLLKNKTSLVSLSELVIDQQIDKADVSFINLKDKSYLFANFQNGKIDLKGNLNSSLWIAPKVSSIVRDLDKTNALSLYLNADIRPLLEKYKPEFDQKGIPTDTLIAYYGGYVDLQLKNGSINQVDTIISYELDDNFEMKPIEKLQQAEVPNIEVAFKTSSHLKNYLPTKIFYKFSKQLNGEYLLLKTSESTVSSIKTIDSPYYFQLYLKPTKVNFPFFSDYSNFFSKFQSIKFRAQQKEKNKSEITGDMLLNKNSIHALYQLF